MDSKAYASSRVEVLFPQCDRKKINKKIFAGELYKAYYAGAAAAGYDLLKGFKDSRPETIEELLGDIQLQFQDTADKLQKAGALYQVKGVSLEEVIDFTKDTIK